MDVREQVELALRNYEGLAPLPLSADLPETEQYLATPDRLGFALGWVVANAIVGARFADSALDALPIYHPEHGWDRFLLTRRVSAPAYANEPADSFGMILLSGEDAPRITHGNGELRLSLGTALRQDPELAIADLLALFPPRGLHGDLGYAWPRKQQHYPRLYQAVTELILEYPGLVAAREIYVDDQPIDGAYHPLYLHGVALQPRMVYDWWLVQAGDRAAFFRVHGGQSIYETDRRGWSTVRKQLAEEETVDDIKRRILAWLRLEGAPSPDTVD
ncbi:MAG: hypothetical protein QJR03_08170 [Sphaerobacter sp.]|nr:hypothetical protein [Sphaerobacter sp.]